MAETSAPRRPGRRVPRWRTLLYLLLPLAGLDALVAANARRWRAYDPNYYRERLDACRRRRWDLVVVGGSPAMCGLDPAVLAGARWRGAPLRRVFNLGLPLGTTLDVCHAVEHGLPRPPRLLVYGIAATDLNASRVGPQGPRYLMGAADVARVARARPAAAHCFLGRYLDERLCSLWSLYYYREGVRLWAADRINRRWPQLCRDGAALARQGLCRSAFLRSERGLLHDGPAPPQARLDRLKASGAPLPPFPYLNRYAVRGYLPYLDRLLDWGARHGVPVLLVNMPFTADVEERLHPAEFAAYRAALAEVSRARGVRVLWPGREELGLTDAHFSDWGHLNADGAARLSAWLRARLQAEAVPPG